MTRSGKSETLSRHRPEPFVEISTIDANKFDLKKLGLAKITSRLADCIFRVRISDTQRPGTIFVPIHWSKENSSGGLIGALFASHTDPVSGQPEGKSMPVRIAPVEVQITGLIISRKSLDPKLPVFWTRASSINCHLHTLAIAKEPDEGWHERVAYFLDVEPANLVVYEDKAADIFRAAHFRGNAIDSAVFISRAMHR